MKKFLIRSLVVIIVLGITFVWGLIVGKTFLSPLPIPDQGYRIFSVTDRHAAAVILKVLAETADLTAVKAFKLGDSHKVILSDGLTAITWFDGKAAEEMPDAISVVVNDPEEAATLAQKIAVDNGYWARVDEPYFKKLPRNCLITYKTDAFLAAGIVFRLHSLSFPFWQHMPKPAEEPIPAL